MVSDTQGQDVDWGAVLERLLRKQSTEGLDYADAVKKSTKAARSQHTDLDKKALKQGVQSFLSSGSGAYIVRDGKVFRKPGRKLAKPADSHPLSGVTEGTHAAAAALAALAGREDHSPHSQKEAPKKRKLPAAAAAGERQQAAPAKEVVGTEETAAQLAGGVGGKERKKHKKQKRAAAAAASQPAEQPAIGAAAEAPVKDASGAEEAAAAKGKDRKAQKQAVKEGQQQRQQQQEQTQQVADAQPPVMLAPPEEAEPQRPVQQAAAEQKVLTEGAQPATEARQEPALVRQLKRSDKKAGSKRKAGEGAGAEGEGKAAGAVGAAEQHRRQRQPKLAVGHEGAAPGPLAAQQEQQVQDEHPAAAGPVAVTKPESGREQQDQEQQLPAKTKQKRGKAAAAAQHELDGEEKEQQQEPASSSEGEQRKTARDVEEPEQQQGQQQQQQQKQPAKKAQMKQIAVRSQLTQAEPRGTPQHSQRSGRAAARPAPAGKVLPPGAESDVKRWRDANKRQDVKSGPFSQAEKDTLRQAVVEYAELHGHSTTDFSWLFDASKKRTKRDQGVWSVIAEALPHRTYKSVWGAGMRMFHPGNYQGRFTLDENARLAQLVAERGTKWKEIGAALGRMPDACKDRWKDIRLGSEKKLGRWTDEETAKLKEAVEEYMKLHKAAQQAGRAAASGEVQVTLSSPAEGADTDGAGADRPLFEEEEGKEEEEEAAAVEGGKGGAASARRQVLDDIDWGLVSRKVGSRSQVQCLEKWYSQLCPSMVERGEWGPGDDRRLLRAVWRGGAAQDFELDWGNLVPGRAAQQVRRRWRLMLKCVPGARNLDFGEIVEYLVEAYMPQLKQQQQGASPHGQQQHQHQQQGQREQVEAEQRQQRQHDDNNDDSEEEEEEADGSQD